MNTTVIGIIVAVLVIGGVGFAVLSSGDDDESQAVTTTSNSQSEQTQTTNETDTNESQDQARTISMTEVSEHSTESDCWTYVGDKVYDITEYIPRHPGGDSILQACGADGTSLFQERETSDGEQVGSGQPHSANAESQLKQLYIGDLAN